MKAVVAALIIFKEYTFVLFSPNMAKLMLIWTFFRRIEFVMNERMNTTYLGLFASIYYIFTTVVTLDM